VNLSLDVVCGVINIQAKGKYDESRLLCGFFIAVSLSAAWAQDEPLPENVAQAYVAYESAMQAQDYPAAETAAETAWRAARQARIDRDLIGVLAANYGELASGLGHHDEAYEAWRASAEIADRINNAPAERAQRWYMASVAAFAVGDLSDSRSCSSRAVQIIERNPGAVPSTLSGDANYLLAKTSGHLGRFRSMGSAARASIEAFSLSQRDYDSIYADAYYTSALEYFFYGNREDAAFDFQMARGIYRQLGADRDRDATVSGYWIRLAQSELRAGELQALDQRVAASPFPWPEPVEYEDANPSAVEEDEDNHDARVLNRREPRFPMRAAEAGLEGIVMVRFAVSPEGQPVDVEIAASAPPGIFDEGSLEAVRGWEYEPKLVDGEAVRRDGVLTQFVYQLAD
jgi:TonB family protein